MTEANIATPLSAMRLKARARQSLLSFSFNIGGLLTGTLLVLYFDVFSIKEAPWALILFPGILNVKGAVGGLFSGHLSTGLHLGTIRSTFTKNTKDFYLLLQAVITLTLISGITVGTGIFLSGVFLWKATIPDFINLLAVIIATMALSIVFVSPITTAFSFLSFRRGLDPDVIVYPIASTVSDIINTAGYIFSLKIFFTLNYLGYYLIGILDLIFLFVLPYILIKNLGKEEFVKILKEFFLTLVFVTFIVNVTGFFLDKIQGIISNGNGAELYVVYPALITTIGGVGSIVGSTLTTKIALGVIKPSFSFIKQHLNEIGGAWAASIVMFTFYSIVSFASEATYYLSDLPKIVVQFLTTNILAVFPMVIIAYAIAIYTYRRGWDPDNFVIPLESSLADSITTLSLLIALTVIA